MTVLVLLVATAGGVRAQEARADDTLQERILDARRRQVDLRVAQEELARSESLLADGLVSDAEVSRRRADREKAELAYQEALIRLFVIQPRLTVREAVKLDRSNGKKTVRLTLVNLTPALERTSLELPDELDSEALLSESLRANTVRDIFVSLKDTGATTPGNAEPMRGATVALPYEHYIAELPYRKPATLEFELLRDVNNVTVYLNLAGQVQEIDLHLQRPDDEQSVRLSSTRLSQEADLGSEAVFDLRLQRSSFEARSFHLQALNLPRQIGHSFVDPESRSRLTEVNFPAGVSERELELRVFLPDRADDAVRLDEAVEFYAVAVPRDMEDRFAADRSYAEGEIVQSGAGLVELSISPRGVGRLEVSSTSLFAELEDDRGLDVEIQIINRGSRRIDNVRLAAEGPLGWRIDTDPKTVPSLEPGDEQAVSLTAQAPEGVTVGSYEIRLAAEGRSFDQRIASPEKIFRVRVDPRRALAGPLVVLGLVVALVVGIVVFGLRLTRR